MIAAVAIETGIPPSVLWHEDPVDLATMVALLEERQRG